MRSPSEGRVPSPVPRCQPQRELRHARCYAIVECALTEIRSCTNGSGGAMTSAPSKRIYSPPKSRRSVINVSVVYLEELRFGVSSVVFGGHRSAVLQCVCNNGTLMVRRTGRFLPAGRLCLQDGSLRFISGFSSGGSRGLWALLG